MVWLLISVRISKSLIEYFAVVLNLHSSRISNVKNFFLLNDLNKIINKKINIDKKERKYMETEFTVYDTIYVLGPMQY